MFEKNEFPKHLEINLVVQFPHSKDIWPTFGVKMAQVALRRHWHKACGLKMAQEWEKRDWLDSGKQDMGQLLSHVCGPEINLQPWAI